MITIEIVKEYTPEIAAGIGALMTSLSEQASGEPMSEQMLRDIIASPWHDQFIARDETGKIVGAATMNYLFAPFAGRIAYLEEIVTDKNYQGLGIGGKIWDEIIRWALGKGATKFEFTSNPKRVAAQAFYKKRGGEIYQTNYFKVKL